MKFKMVADINNLTYNIANSAVNIREVMVDKTELIEILEYILPLAMEEVKDPDTNGKSPIKYIENLLSNKLGDFSNRLILVYEKDNQIVGVLISLPNNQLGDDVYYITTLGVYKDYRNQSIGKKLMRECAVRLQQRSESIKRLILDVHSHNTGAIRFYESIGFTRM